eukprot:TRINITY_DN3974_c0_g1_i2.p1 TRINITY_DN3974_c0_g1~~TRINITY_DN3974_c0_g1_i2.p1  ORF type:complete len:377 (+),score=81.87 TRINITY_DN3974_c0_g1_i2:24-1154(+)
MIEKSQLENLQDLDSNIDVLLTSLQVPPQAPFEADVMIFGWIYLNQMSKRKWKKYHAVLHGDSLNLYKTPSMEKHKSVHTITWWKEYEPSHEDKLNIRQEEDGIQCTKRTRIITDENVLSLSYESNDIADEWHEALTQLMRQKYEPEEYAFREETMQEIEPLISERTDLLHQKYALIVMALESSGFFIEPNHKKIREGFIHIRKNDYWKKLYAVLYRDYIYFFRPHDKVTVNTNPYNFIYLKFIKSVEYDEDNEKNFIIRTSLRSIKIRARHYIAAEEWIQSIQDTLGKKFKGVSQPRTIIDNQGYHYSKSIVGKMSIVEFFPSGKRKVHKFHKKNNGGSIGRSSSADITVTNDDYVSRYIYSLHLLTSKKESLPN